MNRLMFMRAGIEKEMLGLEVAPWFNPTVAKSDGYNVRTLDVFDDATLMERAKEDYRISEDQYSKLEPVDYVGNASNIAELVDPADHGTFDYILSSHNFEHLPNPIKFLQGCATLLKPGGQLIMAIPDGRACFDYFRPHTVTADWLAAFQEERDQPTSRDVFASTADFALEELGANGQTREPAFDAPATSLHTNKDLRDLWKEWQDGVAEREYRDAHCSVFTPSSFQLLLEDCRYLGLTSFERQELLDTQGVEFIVKLKRLGDGEPASSAEEHAARRTELLHATWNEHAVRQGPLSAVEMDLKMKLANASFRDRIVHAVKLWNRARKRRRRARRASA